MPVMTYKVATVASTIHDISAMLKHPKVSHASGCSDIV